jgi:hypothetical protein
MLRRHPKNDTHEGSIIREGLDGGGEGAPTKGKRVIVKIGQETLIRRESADNIQNSKIIFYYSIKHCKFDYRIL